MRYRLQRGTTLIELMVALVISLVLSLAVFGVMSTFEGKRRTIGSNTDLDQAGTVAMFQIDRAVRSSGTGLVQGNSYTYGCQLFAKNAGGTLLPASTLPAPFDTLAPDGATVGAFRMQPVLIVPGGTVPSFSVATTATATSDALIVMSSGSDGGQLPTVFTAAADNALLSLPNTVAFTSGDLVLLVDQQPATNGGPAPCMVTQAGLPASTTLPLSGNYYAAAIGSAQVSGYSATGAAIDLGASSGLQAPMFQLLGVGNNKTLYSYDLLQIAGGGSTVAQPQAEGVFELHALYGVDTNSDGKIDSWVTATGTYAPSSLQAGTADSAALLKTIRAVRVGLIMRAALPERKTVAASTTLTLFSDLGSALTYTRTLATTTTEVNYRYRTIEETIPVRNNQF
jgi:type IV pilus assembly protein PilW